MNLNPAASSTRSVSSVDSNRATQPSLGMTHTLPSSARMVGPPSGRDRYARAADAQSRGSVLYKAVLFVGAACRHREALVGVDTERVRVNAQMCPARLESAIISRRVLDH
jgi:hypothetical protein